MSRLDVLEAILETFHAPLHLIFALERKILAHFNQIFFKKFVVDKSGTSLSAIKQSMTNQCTTHSVLMLIDTMDSMDCCSGNEHKWRFAFSLLWTL